MTRRVSVGIAKIAAIVVALDAAIFYLRLGWFLPIVWTAGLFLALVLTKQERVINGKRIAGTAAVVLLYAAVTAAAWQLFFDRKSEVEFEMTWDDRGDANSYSEPEIVLSFAQFPGHSVGIYSRQLKQLLESRGHSMIRVAFETASDFGCPRGYRAVRIDGVTSWQSSWSYVRSDQSIPEPWGPKPWWCP
jgi:hypothetical protein